MSISDLSGDQLRRIYRDYLKGVPNSRNQKKFGISEDELFEVVDLYKKRKHANDVGGAPALVTAQPHVGEGPAPVEEEEDDAEGTAETETKQLPEAEPAEATKPAEATATQEVKEDKS